MIEIKWDDIDPRTGGRRFLRAVRFARAWEFSYRLRRRDVRWRTLTPTREMWEHVHESLQKRYRRREGVSDEDVKEVARVLANWKTPPPDEDDESQAPLPPEEAGDE